MASKNIRGITIEIGGDTSKLGKAIESNEKQVRSLQGELKEIDRLLKFDPGNTELLTQKQNILTQAIDETSQKLNTLKDAEAQVIEQFERGEIAEEQLRAFQREIMKTENTLSRMQSQLTQTQEATSDMGAEASDTRSNLEKLTDTISDQERELTDLKEEYTNVVLSQGKNSTEAKDLERKMQDLNSELKKNKTTLKDAKGASDDFTSALDDAGDTAEDTEGGFTIMKGALADLTASAITGAISAVGNLISSLMDLSEATEEFRIMQAKLEGSANTFGYEMEFVNEKYKEFYSYVGDDQMATNAITNLLGLGTSTESLTALAEGAIGVWSAYGDSIPIEGLTEALNETAQVAKVTGSLADALNWAGISEDDVNAKLETMATTQERADYIAQTLNDTYGESKRTYDELTGSVTESRESQAELMQTQAELGEALAPVNSAFTDLKNQALQAITPLVKDLASAFTDLLTWLKEHPAVLNTLTALVIALASGFTVLAGALAIQALINGVQKAFALLNITMLANPIVLVIAGITALVAGFIYLWNTSDSFRQFWINLWNLIVEATRIAVDAIVNFFTVTIPEKWEQFKTYVSEFATNVSNKINEMWTSIISFFIETIPAWIDSVIAWFEMLPYNIGVFVGTIIKYFLDWVDSLVEFATVTVPEFIDGVVEWFAGLPQKIWNAILSAIDFIVRWGSEMKAKATTAVTTMITQVVAFFSELPGKIWAKLVEVVNKVIEWGSNMLREAKRASQDVVDGVVNKIKELPGKMLTIGKDIVRGIWDGITSMTGWIGDKISSFIDGIFSIFQEETDSHSPSRRSAREVGKPVGQGVGVGILQATDEVNDDVAQLVDSTMASVDGASLERSFRSTLGLDGLSRNMSISNGALSGKVDRLIAILTAYLPDILNGMDRPIVLDDGTLVGALAPQMDAELANIASIKKRGG